MSAGKKREDAREISVAISDSYFSSCRPIRTKTRHRHTKQRMAETVVCLDCLKDGCIVFKQGALYHCRFRNCFDRNYEKSWFAKIDPTPLIHMKLHVRGVHSHAGYYKCMSLYAPDSKPVSNVNLHCLRWVHYYRVFGCVFPEMRCCC